MKKVNPIRIKFYEFLNDDIGKNEFQQWMYSAKELENEFPEDHYVDLISFPYKTGEAKEYITKIVTTFFDYKEYELWRTINLLEDISKGEIEIVLASRKLRNLYNQQQETLERPLITIKLGIGYESMMDEFPTEDEYDRWNQEALKKKLETVNFYQDDLIMDASIELEEIRTNKIY